MSVSQIKPIDLYFWSTPNGYKISVALEELGVPYDVTFVDISRREQFKPEFEAISPNHQIPAIVDPEGPGGAPISVFQSGAILLYLGRKFGRLYPIDDERGRVEVETWLMFQMGDFGPLLGQAHHFNLSAPVEDAYAIRRYHKIAQRLYAVLEQRLVDREFVAADFSIADIALYCWAWRFERHRIDLADYPGVKRWFDRISERPAVRRGMAVLKPGHVDRVLVNPMRKKTT
jgi:GSH-dependent disulfide-bond oxidoreductase